MFVSVTPIERHYVRAGVSQQKKDSPCRKSQSEPYRPANNATVVVGVVVVVVVKVVGDNDSCTCG